MWFVPKVMSTQHPDNATPAPFADAEGVLKGEGEVDEAAEIFALGCNEQMWDSEGKEADNHVVQKLLTGYADFFRNERRLGHDVILTLRVPNPSVERDMRKSMVEALQSVPSAWDVASGFYADMDEDTAPIQEVILPFTTSAAGVDPGRGVLPAGHRGAGSAIVALRAHWSVIGWVSSLPRASASSR